MKGDRSAWKERSDYVVMDTECGGVNCRPFSKTNAWKLAKITYLDGMLSSTEATESSDVDSV